MRFLKSMNAFPSSRWVSRNWILGNHIWTLCLTGQIKWCPQTASTLKCWLICNISLDGPSGWSDHHDLRNRCWDGGGGAPCWLEINFYKWKLQVRKQRNCDAGVIESESTEEVLGHLEVCFFTSGWLNLQMRVGARATCDRDPEGTDSRRCPWATFLRAKQPQRQELRGKLPCLPQQGGPQHSWELETSELGVSVHSSQSLSVRLRWQDIFND